MSAASCHHKTDIRDISIAEKGMREIGQDPLFMIRARDKKLDQILDEGSYKIIDEANIYCTLC